jgi:arginase
MDRSHIAVIGAPLDLGAGRRGVDMGPSAIRVAQLNARLVKLGYIVEDCGNVEVEQPENRPAGLRNARYLAEILAVCERLSRTTRSALDRGHMPLVLGGDHSVAMGTIAGVAAHYRAQGGRRVGVIWVDAHADMNTPETSPSGNVHGMPLACAIGLGPPELTALAGFTPSVEAVNVALVGIRDVDQLEKPHVKESGVRAFTMREVDERGMRTVMAEAIRIATAGTAGFHLSFDMDVVDPVEAPGVGTPVRGGITYREAHLAMEVACDSRGMVSMEVVEVNPVLDVANRTADLAVELVMSALGKRIL